jgi:N-methylhydantoinase A/oxoprolinase/acetone carboxylase beta subunit
MGARPVADLTAEGPVGTASDSSRPGRQSFSPAERAGVAAGTAATDPHALKGTRPAYFAECGGFVDTAVYDRERLAAGDEITGPAVIEEAGSTLVLGPSAAARVAASGNVVVTLG